MTSLDHSVQGAKHQSFRRSNPRECLVSLIETHPEADDAELLKLFADAVERDDGYLAVVIEYWFVNNLNNLRGRPRTAGKVHQTRTEAAKFKSQAKTALCHRYNRGTYTRPDNAPLFRPCASWGC
jgi:hypothetical protein